MKIERAASVPLIVHDPYFSIWSGGGHLNDCDTSHWSGARQAVRGYVVIDGTPYCFMGDPEFSQTIGQTGLSVTPTSTEYQFENEWITMQVRFTSRCCLTICCWYRVRARILMSPFPGRSRPRPRGICLFLRSCEIYGRTGKRRCAADREIPLWRHGKGIPDPAGAQRRPHDH